MGRRGHPWVLKRNECFSKYWCWSEICILNWLRGTTLLSRISFSHCRALPWIQHTQKPTPSEPLFLEKWNNSLWLSCDSLDKLVTFSFWEFFFPGSHALEKNVILYNTLVLVPILFVLERTTQGMVPLSHGRLRSALSLFLLYEYEHFFILFTIVSQAPTSVLGP